MLAPTVLQSLEVKVQSELLLRGDIAAAQDVRWAEGKAVFLAVSPFGAVNYSLDEAAPRILSRTGHGSGEVVMTSLLARSDSYLGVASLIYEVGWRRHGQAEGLADKQYFEFVEDIALFGDRLAVLGIRRDDDRQLAPTGGIGWLARLGRESVEFRPIQFSQTGPGARAFDFCRVSELGVLRFLADGSLVLVPGAEPDVFLLDASAKQVYTWETEPLGIGMRCDHSEEKRDLLSRDVLARRAWINQFEIVDEILPVGGEIGLITRRVSGAGVVSWRLVVLYRGKPPLWLDLPLTFPSDHGHLHADLRGKEAVFLLYQSGATLPHKTKATPSKLVFAEFLL